MTFIAPEFDWLRQLIKASGACSSHGGSTQGQVSCGQAPSYWKEWEALATHLCAWASSSPRWASSDKVSQWVLSSGESWAR